MRDYADVREAIAVAAGDTLRKLLAPSIASRARTGKSPRVVNPDAYRFYMLGQRALDRRGLSVQVSVEHFSRAVAIDSNYAEGWAGLSMALALTPWFTNIRADAVAPEVRSAAARVLQLDSTLAPPHVALGLMHQLAYQWDSAETELRRGVQLRSATDVEGLVQYGRHLEERGRRREAMTQYLTARKTEPASALVSAWMAHAFFANGRLDSALAEISRAIQSDSSNFPALLLASLIYVGAGDTAKALRSVSRLPMSPNAIYLLSGTYDTAAALERVRKLERMTPQSGIASMSRAYAMLGIGDTSAAMTALESATDAHESWPSWGGVTDPIYGQLWGSARFRRLITRAGLGDVKLPPSAPR